MKIFDIKDSNGKDFKVSIDDIEDFNTALDENFNIEDAVSKEDLKKIKDFNMIVKDESNNVLSIEDAIKENKNGNKKISHVHATVEATHSGLNLNDYVYDSESMTEDQASWRVPYAKPVIKNHNSYSEPLGRIFDTNHGASEIIDDRDCINLVMDIRDKDSIEKVLDGRYKTVSVGGRAGHVKCNTCGKDILKDGVFKFCGHWRGESYAGKKCSWTGKNITYNECSMVNKPADVYAIIKECKVFYEDDGSDKKDDKTPPKDANDKPNNINDSNADDMDDLLKDKAKEPEGKKDTDKVEDNKTDQNEIATLNDKIKDWETKYNDVVIQKSNIANDNETLKDNAKKLKTDLDLSSEEVSSFRDKATRFAQSYKESVIQRVLDNLLITKELEKDKTKISDKREELSNKTVKELKELNNLIDYSVDKTPESSKVHKTTNPGVVDDKDDEGDDEDHKASKKKENKITLEDFEKSFSARY